MKLISRHLFSKITYIPLWYLINKNLTTLELNKIQIKLEDNIFPDIRQVLFLVKRNRRSVTACPQTIYEWEKRARLKNCTSLAFIQNCTETIKFKYHCVHERTWRRIPWSLCTRILYTWYVVFFKYASCIRKYVLCNYMLANDPFCLVVVQLSIKWLI